MASRRREGALFWVGLAVCVPFVYASSYWAQGGPPRAEGCSGGSGDDEGSGFTWLSAPEENDVARDAFFTFHAETIGIAADDALAGIAIEVRDEDDNLVEGSAQLLSQESSAGRRQLFIGWSASETRTAGETLTANASAAGDFGTFDFSASLAVNAADPELELPAFSPESWARVTYGAEGDHECEGESSCGETVRFGDDTTSGYGAYLTAPPLSTEVVVAWEYSFEEVADKGRLTYASHAFLATRGDEYAAYVNFGDELDEYCVRVRGRDLRTGAVDSRLVCAAPTGPFATWSSDSIGACLDMPAGFEERWCAAQSANGFMPAECEPFLPPGNGGSGAGGEPGTGGVATGTGGVAEPGSGGVAGTDIVVPVAGEGGTGDSPTGTGGTALGSGGAAGTHASSGGAPDSAAGESGDDGAAPRVIRTYGGCGCRTSRQGASPVAALLVLLGLYGARRTRAARRRT